MRRAAKVDQNHAEIVTALRAAGASVQSLASVGGGCPDLLVGYHGTDFKLEVKHPSRKNHELAPPEQRQATWREKWQGQPIITVRCVSDALKAIGVE